MFLYEKGNQSRKPTMGTPSMLRGCLVMGRKSVNLCGLIFTLKLVVKSSNLRQMLWVVQLPNARSNLPLSPYWWYRDAGQEPHRLKEPQASCPSRDCLMVSPRPPGASGGQSRRGSQSSRVLWEYTCRRKEGRQAGEAGRQPPKAPFTIATAL